MELKERIDSLVQLGEVMMSDSTSLQAAKHKAKFENPWFTDEFMDLAISNIANHMLSERSLRQWTEEYDIKDAGFKKVGIVMAGNIPLVGFHDMLAVYVSGHHSVIKLSSKDEVLMNWVLTTLEEINSKNAEYFTVVDRLKDYDAVIATGSDNSALYFEQYFGHVPHIIRKNRNGIAVIHGDETRDDFINLGKDIFTYFGLGCRNVSKLYVPEGYEFDSFLEATHDEYKALIHHHKYKNNFDYNMAIFMLNKDEFYNNGPLILRKNDSFFSRISSVNYERYEHIDLIEKHLDDEAEKIQCIISTKPIGQLKTYRPGMAQCPHLNDYADGVNTLSFLTQLYD